VCDKQGERRTTQDPIGRAAGQQFMQTRVAIAAHHQQLCIELAAFFDERVSNLVFLADGAIFNGIDAVMPEVMNGLVAPQRLRFR